MVRRANDMDAVSKIINHPKVFDMAKDDYTPDPVVADPDAFYIINDEETGVIRVDPISGCTCIVHVAALPELWGKTKEFVKEALDWGLRNTGFMKAIALVPTENSLATKLCLDVGFRFEGFVCKSIMRDFELRDQFLFGLTKFDFYKGEGSCQ